MGTFAADAMVGRHVLVTGASSGLGRETAIALSRAGARVTLMGRDEARLTEACAALAPGNHGVKADSFTDLDATADAIKALAGDRGAFDGIFHSAGAELIRPMRMLKDEQLASLLGAALFGSMGIAKAAASRNIMNDAGSLVFMSSVAGVRGTAGMAAYSASKAAIDGLVRSLACELAGRRIRVNSIAAGGVQTEMHDRLTKTLGEQGVQDYERRHLLGFGRAVDVANAALFLLGDGSAWITGTTLLVDGGYAAH